MDIQSEIPLKLTYQLQQRVPRQARYPGDRLPSIDEFPILNQEHASRVIHAKFVKFCGDDEVCQSRLKVTPVFDLRTGEGGRDGEDVGRVDLEGSVDAGRGRDLAETGRDLFELIDRCSYDSNCSEVC